jgi:aerobic carbon-monoxide dehydrogenase small subunit
VKAPGDSMNNGLKGARTVAINVTVNGTPWSGEVSSGETLLDFLRDRIGLKGTKRSCESQVCGACTVLVGNQAISSCSYLAWEARNKGIVTIEGLAQGETLDPVQEAFVRYGAIQCGYCTPGMVMMVKALLNENPHPSRQEIRTWLNGSLCRCSAYVSIEQAVLDLAARK